MLQVLLTIDRFLDFLGSGIMNQPETVFSGSTLQIYSSLKTLTNAERLILYEVVDDAWGYIVGSVYTNSCVVNQKVVEWLRNALNLIPKSKGSSGDAWMSRLFTQFALNMALGQNIDKAAESAGVKAIMVNYTGPDRIMHISLLQMKDHIKAQ